MRRCRWVILVALFLVAGCSKNVGKTDAQERATASVKKAMRYVEQGDRDAAIDAYRVAIDRNPELARAHFDVALLLQDHKKDWVGAIYHYRRYLEMRPTTEKRAMIKDRIRISGQAYATKVLRIDRSTERRAELEAENRALRARIKEIQQGATGQTIRTDDARPRIHRVQPGDNLTTIALRVYGDAEKADAIFQANKNKLRTMNDVRVGQDLILP